MLNFWRHYRGTVVIAAMVSYCAFEPPWLWYQNLPFPPQALQVRPGDVIPLTVIRCSSAWSTRFYDVTHELRSLDDPKRIPVIMRVERVKIEPGCHTSTSMVNVIPPETAAGTYYAAGLGIVEGIAHSIEVPWYSGPFKVVRP